MLFNSPEFIIFLVLVYGLYRVLPFRPQNYMLLLASYIFYGWWDPRFLFLVILSTTVDFWMGLLIDRGRLTRHQMIVPAAVLLGSALALLNLLPSILVLLELRTPSNAGTPAFSLLQIFPAVVAFIALSYLFYTQVKVLDEKHRKWVCVFVSVTTQLGLLGFFKYFNFFADSLQEVLASIGLHSETWHLNIILPVGISFYTFQSLSYTIDIYRGTLRSTPKFLDFALFVAYFPQLQAGPIERAKHLIPQISNPRTLTLNQSMEGLYLIVLGFFKKVGIADGVAVVVTQVYNSHNVSSIDVAVATLLFAVQIYCDFSGYTDIARGASKLLGIDLMINFNNPYFSKNPQEFWRRWHISLSTWLRDYLYVPLGGSRGTLNFICRNLMLTMVLGGLWHGAALNFLAWGFFQGTALCVYRIWRHWRPEGAQIWNHPLAQVALMCIFFVITCYGWLLFRANSFEQIFHFTHVLITGAGGLTYAGGMPRFSAILGLAILSVFEVAQYRFGHDQFLQKLYVPAQGFAIAAMMTIIMMGMSNEPAQFIYFQF